MTTWRLSRSSTLTFRIISQRGMRHKVLNDQDEVDLASSDTSSRVSLLENDRGEPVHLGKLINDKVKSKQPFCSYELFPTKNQTVYHKFFSETSKCEPIFYALTWHEESNKSGERFPSLKTAEVFPKNTLLHCTAGGLKRDEVDEILNRALELGIFNIFALKGDADTDDGDFNYASDLVTYIREHYGNKFSICVAGYPETHPNSPSKELDLRYLKAKVDAGADFIITQFFFESEFYVKFVKDCRDVGITVPIIPGVYPFTNAKLLDRMIDICCTRLPDAMRDTLEKIKDDDEAVAKFGLESSLKIIKEIREKEHFYGYHLYTLNRPRSATEIYRQLAVET